MRRHAKASSAGTTSDRGGSLGSIRRAFATRGASGDANGSGAPSGRLAVVFLAAALALLAMAPSAFAATTRLPTGSFGADGTSGTSFGNPSQLAFNQANDKLYVLDRSVPAIRAFDAPAHTPAGGSFPLSVAETGGEPDLSVDNTLGASANNIYYLSELSGLFGFNSAGAPLGGSFPVTGFGDGCGSAVDSAGSIWVGDYGTRSVRKLSSSGTFEGGVTTSSQGRPCHVALDSNGDLFVAMYGGATWKYAAPAYTTATEIDSATTSALTVDTAAHRLYIAHAAGVSAYNSSTGAFLYTFASGVPSRGVAVDQGADDVFVSDFSGKVLVFGPAQNFADATATPTAAQNVSYFSADIGGTIDDNNALPTHWRLEVSSNNFATATTVSSGTTTGGQSGVVVSGTATGLSLNTDYKFRVVTNKGNNQSSAVASSSLAFKTLFAPNATGTPTAATNLTDTSADIAATIDDNGALPTNWRLELSSNGGFDWGTASSGQTAGGQTGAVVSASLTGLAANSNYEFRVVTNKGTNAETDVTSASLPFSTLAVPPVVSDLGAVNVSDTSARLTGTINPKNAATDYVFEYGTTPAFGSSTDPLAIGGGTTPIVVSQVIQGLNPNTTYYLRLVATNVSGPGYGNATFHTRASPLPNPENRGWEQVTPPEKNYGDADKVATYHPNVAGVSPDGDSVGFCTTALFGDSPGRMTQYCAPYMARRASGGWQTGHPFPEYCRTDPVSGVSGGDMVPSVSADFSHFVIRVSESGGCSNPPLDPDAPLDDNNPQGVASNLYVEDPSANPFSFHLLNNVISDSVRSATERFVGGSDDFSRVVYVSGSNQTAPPDSPPPGNFQKVYHWEKQGEGGCAQPDGCLVLLSKDPSNTPFATGSGVPSFCCVGASAFTNPSAVSRDGKRVYFNNPVPGPSNSIGIDGACGHEPGCEIYLRKDGATTVDVSESECTLGPAACGSPQSQADYFLYATPSGEDAFVTTCARLTDESAPDGCPPGQVGSWNDGGGTGGLIGAKLFRWDENASAGHHLVDLTVDHEPGDGVQPELHSVIGTSDDGDTVFFTAKGQIVSGEPTPAGFKLYRWQWSGGVPTVDYLGPYEEAIGTSGQDANATNVRRQVTPDGKYMLIYSALRLDPVADTDEDSDAYRWDEADGWICASCQLPGTPSAGGIDLEEVYLKYYETLDPSISNLEMRIFMSDDGQRIFFGTPDALVPQDVNGEPGCPLDAIDQAARANLYTCEDVYEWHDGAVSLVSSGTGNKLSRIIGASASGDDVFFYTAQRLVGWDRDNNTDIYDARVGGGFPEPPAQPAACEGEACRGAGTAAPSVTGAGTAAFEGPGNPPSELKCKQGFGKRHGRCVKKKARKHHKRQQEKHKQRAAKNDRRTGR